MNDDMTIEERLARLETLLAKVIVIARANPMGAMFLRKMGL